METLKARQKDDPKEVVIATRNLAETHGIFPLPQAQLDRFLLSFRIGYPDHKDEVEILEWHEHGQSKLDPVLSAEEIVALQEEVTRVGEKELLGGKGKAVYGFNVRVGIGGKPIIESFGNVKATKAGPVVAEMREPLVDIFDEGDEVRVVAETPGVAEKDIQIEIKGDILILTAEAGDNKYHKELLLPSAVEPEVQRKSYRNGVLELRLKKLSHPQ